MYEMDSLRLELSDIKREIQEMKSILLHEETRPDQEELEHFEVEEGVCADLFKALSNEERIKILKSLANGDQYFAQLKEITGLDHSPLRFHLTVLKDVNLISQERFRGKYSITELGRQALLMASSFFKLMRREED